MLLHIVWPRQLWQDTLREPAFLLYAAVLIRFRQFEFRIGDWHMVICLKVNTKNARLGCRIGGERSEPASLVI